MAYVTDERYRPPPCEDQHGSVTHDSVKQATHILVGGVARYDAVDEYGVADAATAEYATAEVLRLIASDGAAHTLNLALITRQDAAAIVRGVVRYDHVGEHRCPELGRIARQSKPSAGKRLRAVARAIWEH